MAWIRVFVSRVYAVFRGPSLDRDLDEELRSHIEMETEANRTRGMTEDEARAAALRDFGGLAQTAEAYRDQRGLPLLETFVQDVRYAARVLRKAPSFAAAAVLSLGLGIGVNTAIFGAVNAALLRPLPVADPGQLVSLSLEQGGASTPLFSYSDYRDIRAEAGNAFADILAYRVGLDGLSVNGRADRIMVHYVSGNYFTLLGVKPALGRLILPSEGDRVGADPVLVLGYSYWQTRFAGDPAVVGERVQIDGHSVTIVGVAPRGFRSVQGLIDVQGFLPLGMVTIEGNYPREVLTARSMRMFSVIGRLRQGVTVDRAGAAMQMVARHLSAAYPTLLAGYSIDIRREALGRLPFEGSQRLMALSALFLALGALVLVLTCLNLASLLMVRATVRRRELAMRAALGGSRRRLIRQLFTESAVLVLLGAVVGLGLAAWTSRAFGTPEVQGIPIHLESVIDWRVLIYTFGAAAITGFALGILPAVRGSCIDLAMLLRDGGQRLSTGSNRVRGAFVAAQVAGSFVLVAVAALLVRSLDNARRLDLGFDPANVVTFAIDPQHVGYDAVQGGKLFRTILDRVRALPDVQSASLGCCGPMSPSPLFAQVQMAGYVPRRGQPDPTIFFNQVSRDFFATLRIPIVRGRGFARSDDARAPRVAVINETMAARYWPGRDAIGRQFQFVNDPRPWMRVIGVVKDGKYLGVTDRAQPYFYVPLEQNYGSSEVLLVRSPSVPRALIAEVRREIGTLAPGLPVTGVETMLERLDESGGFGLLRWSALLAAALGALGVALALVGLYGVISYTAMQRAPEIGIRIALGADAASIRRLVMGEGATIVCFGIAVGAVIALAAAPLVRRFLIGIAPTDPRTYAEVAIAFLLVALGACYGPVRRATRIDPATTLRAD